MIIGYFVRKNRRDLAVNHLLTLLVTLSCVHAPEPDKEEPASKENREDVELFQSHYGFGEDDDAPVYNSRPFPYTPNGHHGHGANIPLSLDHQPAFSAVRAHPAYRLCPRGECIVIFENILGGSGQSFDKKAGLFLCPVPGLYYFTFSALSPSYSSFRIALCKNNQEVISAYGSAKGYAMAGNSVILSLQTGDKVCLKLLEGELYESDAPYRAYTSFSGFMVRDYGGVINHGHHNGGGNKGGGKYPNREPFPGSGGHPEEAGPRSLPSKDLNGNSELLIS